MSRIRYLKPGFFTDDDLGECSPLARLLFAGLWTIADREGRLEDRPRRIKALVLPYDSCDCDALLNELVGHTLIVRYEVEGCRYISIPTWLKHQKPHSKEPPSEIPEPGGSHLFPARSDLDPAKSDLDPAKSDQEPVGSHLARARNGNYNRNLRNPIAATDRGDGELFPETVEDVGGNGNGSGDAVKQFLSDEFEKWWGTYPRKQGKRKDAKAAWLKMGAQDRRDAMGVAEKMRAIVDAGGKKLTFIPYATTFLNGRRWEEWADGTPPDWGGEVEPAKVAISNQPDLEPWQRYALSWFDEPGWNVRYRRSLTEEEDNAIRSAVESGRLTREDVLAGKSPCNR